MFLFDFFLRGVTSGLPQTALRKPRRLPTVCTETAEDSTRPGFESSPGQGSLVTLSKIHYFSGSQVSHTLLGDNVSHLGLSALANQNRAQENKQNPQMHSYI